MLISDRRQFGFLYEILLHKYYTVSKEDKETKYLKVLKSRTNIINMNRFRNDSCEVIKLFQLLLFIKMRSQCSSRKHLKNFV